MLYEFLRKINLSVKKKLFQREVESSFYSNKKFALPRIHSVKQSELGQYKKNYPFSFFNSAAASELICKELNRLENKEQIIKSANSVLDDTLFLYSKEISLEKINWNKDPLTGYEYPKELIWKKDYFQLPANTDIKNTWEIARMHSLILLGKAYLVTSDEVYTQKYIQLLYDFISSNPFCASVNWTDSSEVSIRTINIVFSLSFFIQSELIDEKFIQDFTETVLQHSVFIEHNLDYKRRRGTGYLLNLLGLMVTGLFLYENYYGKRLFHFAFNNFEQEIRNQVHEDGVSTEQSIPYHTIALEAFYLAKIFSEKAGHNFSEGYNDILKNKFNVHYNYLREDNSVPQLGDSISSRILPLNFTDIKLNYPFPMAAGAYLFNEGKYKYFFPQGSAELLFLFGPEYIEKYSRIDTAPYFQQSSAFAEGGHYIMRSPETHLFIEAGEIGNKGEGAPGHNDIFSFELYYKNKLFIADPGSYSFYSDTVLRNKMRSVKYHNSISVDNELLASFNGNFGIKEDITMPKVLEWKSDNEEDHLTIQHFAYAKLFDPVICKRTFSFYKYKHQIKIKDELLGGSDHSASANIILHPKAEVHQVEKHSFIVKVDGEQISIKFSSPSDHFFTSIQKTEFSVRYGELEKSDKISIYLKEKFPAFYITEINLL